MIAVPTITQQWEGNVVNPTLAFKHMSLQLISQCKFKILPDFKEDKDMKFHHVPIKDEKKNVKIPILIIGGLIQHLA